MLQDMFFGGETSQMSPPKTKANSDANLSADATDAARADFPYADVTDDEAYAEAADDIAHTARRRARMADAKTIAELRAELARVRALLPNALTGRLSPSKIRQLMKLGKRNPYSDGGNLYLQVSPNGKDGSWIFRWTDRKTGKPRNMGLGSYRTIDLNKARELALHYRTALSPQKNLDPFKVRDGEKLDIKIAQGLVKTVSQVVDEWFEKKIARKAPRYRNKVFNQLRKWVHPTIGDMPIEKVDTKTILEPTGLGEAWSRINSTAKDVLSCLNRIFNFASRMKYFHKANPADWQTLLDVLPPREEVYQRQPRAALVYTDVGRFLQAVRNYQDRSDRKTGRTNISYVMEFVVLTGVRISEVLEAQWKEFDRATMTWNVPPEHRKNGKRKGNKVRPVPITKSLDKVLDEMEERRTDPSPDALVFPSPRTGREIKTSSPANFIVGTLKWEIKITPHGFRSTLRDWMRAEVRDFKEVFWKAQVDHQLGDGTATDGAYGHNLLLEQRRPLMQMWDDYCARPQPPPKKSGKILKLSDKRRSA
jgi:integrase